MNENDKKDPRSSVDNTVQDEKDMKTESKSGKENNETNIKAESTEEAEQMGERSKEKEINSGGEKEGESALLQKKCDDLNDKYLRLAAEFDNYRRRTAKERLDLISSAGEEIIKGLLPILDDCERAIAVLKESKDIEAAKEGTELIYNKLMAFLKSRGLAVIEARGKVLDTDFHEAAAQFPVEDKEKKNTIIDVIQEGYTLNGKVIRFAKVVVGI